MAEENAARTTIKEAFAALDAEIGRFSDDDTALNGLSALHRSALIAYAEANVQRPPTAKINASCVAVGRVQSLYVAGMLAAIDEALQCPFKDAELRAEFEAQCRFIREKRRAASTSQTHLETRRPVR